MIGGLQGKNGDLNNKYLKKKYKRVGCKYLEALRWISQACKMGCKSPFCSQRLISQFAPCDFAVVKLAFNLA